MSRTGQTDMDPRVRRCRRCGSEEHYGCGEYTPGDAVSRTRDEALEEAAAFAEKFDPVIGRRGDATYLDARATLLALAAQLRTTVKNRSAPPSDADARIAAAVEAEREECAKVADRHVDKLWAGEIIATEIRARSTSAKGGGK